LHDGRDTEDFEDDLVERTTKIGQPGDTSDGKLQGTIMVPRD
jgi:hypothetical protein